MMQALTGATDRFLEEMRVSREQEREGTNTMSSLFREAIGTIKDTAMRLQSLQGVSDTQVAPRPTEFLMDIQMPSTSRATYHGWMGVEGCQDWPPVQMASMPLTNRFLRNPRGPYE